MKLRKPTTGTGFRSSQARVVLLGILKTLAPRMMAPGLLRGVVRDIAEDSAFWRDVDEPLRVHGEASTSTSSAMSPLVKDGRGGLW